MGVRKPCPFCGRKDRICEGDMIDGGPILVCQYCYATGPEGTSKRDAVRLWNKRADAKQDGAPR